MSRTPGVPSVSHHDIARIAHDAIETHREVTGQPKRGPWSDQSSEYREGMQHAVEEVYEKGYDILDETDRESHLLGAVCYALADEATDEVIGSIGDPHVVGEGPFGGPASTEQSAETGAGTTSTETEGTSSSPTSDASSDSSSAGGETKGPSDPGDLAPVGG